MGISIIDNFDYRAGKPNFTRDLFENIEEMVAFPEMYLPAVFECNIKSGDRYRFNANNEVDPILGKWRLVNVGNGGPVSGYTKDEINAKLDKKLDKPEAQGEEGQFLSLDADGKNIFVDLPQYDDTEIRGLIEDLQLGNLSYEIVEQLPDSTLQTVDPNVLYLVKTDTDVFNPFVFSDGAFKSLGSTTGGTVGPVTSEDVSYSNTAIDSVTNVQTALDALIAKVYYVAPKINSFTCSPSQLNYEIGQKVTSIVFNWSYNKEIANQTLTDCDVSDITVRSATYDTVLTTNKTFVLSCGDGQNSATASKAFTFSSKVHSGSASIPTSYNSEFILSLNGQLKSNKSGTYTVNVQNGQYFFIALPSTYNNSDVLVGKVDGFSTEFSRVATIQHINSSGYESSYNIYKSTNSSLGNISFVV